ncbi:MAG: dihydrolipoyl dehydrogenase [Candidatus Caldarchaeum sp.]
MMGDVVVVGGGPGGYVAAIRLSQLGLKTTLIEKDELGGECTNWGCIPSKHLIGNAKKIHSIKELAAKNILASSVPFNMAKISESTKQVVHKLRQGIAYLLKANGVTVVKGEAVFEKPGLISVKKNDGEQKISAENIIIATGTEPVSLPSIPFDGTCIIDYRKALFLDKVPKKFLVVGGGAVGAELGTAYAHLGSDVTVVEVMNQLLPGFDADASRLLKRGMEKIGVKIHLSTTVSEYSYFSDGVKVVLSNGFEDVFDLVLVAVGKRPTSWTRRLVDLGVELDAKGYVKTDEKMQTTAAGVYAVGDVTGPPFLAHKASHQGIVAAEAIAGLDSRFDGLVPYGVFTSPEVAAVGLSTDAAKEAGYDVVEARFPYTALGRAITDGEDGFVKLIADRKTDRLLGAVVVGPHATETIAVLTTIIKSSATLEDVSKTVFIHPTYSEAIGESMLMVKRRAIHYVTK